jgi:hypothetical protein
MNGINWPVVPIVYTPDTLLNEMVNSIKTTKHAIDARVIAWNKRQIKVSNFLNELSNSVLCMIGRNALTRGFFSSQVLQQLLTLTRD